MLGFHKLYFTTYPTGDVINIFASVKIDPDYGHDMKISNC